TNKSMRRVRPAGLQEAATAATAAPVAPSEQLAKSKPTPVHKPAKRRVTLFRLLAVLVASAVIGIGVRYILANWNKPEPLAAARTLLVTRAGQKGGFISI